MRFGEFHHDRAIVDDADALDSRRVASGVGLGAPDRKRQRLVPARRPGIDEHRVGEGYVLRAEGHAVVPGHIAAEVKGVAAPVGRDFPSLGKLGTDPSFSVEVDELVENEPDGEPARHRQVGERVERRRTTGPVENQLGAGAIGGHGLSLSKEGGCQVVLGSAGEVGSGISRAGRRKRLVTSWSTSGSVMSSVFEPETSTVPGRGIELNCRLLLSQ